jgi:oxygen-independent coproporphyrinogen-3 oxidase
VTDPIRIRVADAADVGSYFVANYPPFSVWTGDAVAAAAEPALDAAPAPGVPLGLYLHIPFCRKRCHFCYFRVYTDKNADEIAGYLDAVVREWELYARRRAIAGRPLKFVYFGGGTPSYLSTRQLDGLVRRMTSIAPWDAAEEITFECEPGTLTDAKLAAIRRMGVTRLSLGIEHFDDWILEINGRAHRSREIGRAYHAARALGFPQINIDLIAGMLGDSDERWKACVERTLALAPDSVTIYQMELPFNTTISADILQGGARFSGQLAPWETRRRWMQEAWEALARAGYTLSSAYTAVRDPSRVAFVYRDSLWQGADLVGLGVASFGHVNGVHMQNLDRWETYTGALDRGVLPLGRAYRPSSDERLIRELVLQLKKGAIRPGYFQGKYGADVLERFQPQWTSLASEGFLEEARPERISLTRAGLLRVDALLHRFFLPEHVAIRYT